MSQFHSLRSYKKNEHQPTRERTPQRVSVMTPPPGFDGGMVPQSVQTEHLPAVSATAYPHNTQLQLARSEQYTPIQGYPHIITDSNGRRTTQSLMLSIPGAVQPTSNGRAPLVIPGSRKRKRTTVALRNTEEFMMPGHSSKSLKLHTRHAIAIASTLGILLFTLLSLSPVGTGQAGNAYFSGSVKWTQADRQNWNIAIKRSAQTEAKTEAQPVTIPQKSSYTEAELRTIARQMAMKYGLSPDLFERQIQKESHFNPYAQSWVGAQGIAQFMPATAAEMGVNVWDPISSLDGAARYMRNLSNYFYGDYQKAVAAYNCGAGNVEYAVKAGGGNWLAFTPAETQDYVAKIYGWKPM